MTKPDANGWYDISSAPRDGTRIAVFGKPEDAADLKFTAPGVHAAYWDSIDEAFCLDGASWFGPFIEPSKWQPLPPPPVDGGAS